MNLRLFQLNVRRGLSPLLGVGLVLVALLIELGVELPDSVGLGSERPGALLRGLRRSDQWLALLLVLLPAAVLQASRIWTRTEQRERLWLLQSSASKASLCLSSWAGAWSAGLVWLVLAAGLCEWSAAGAGQGDEWRLDSSLQMHDVQRFGEGGHLRWTSTVTPAAKDGLVRFSVGLYGLDNQAQSFELRSIDARGEVHGTVTVEPASRSILEVAVPAAGGEVPFEFLAHGARRTLALHGPQLDHFVPTTRFGPTLYLMQRIVLLLAVAQALVLGIGAWFTAPTALLYVVAGYALLWVEGDRLAETWVASWIPAFDLPAAIGWIAAGRGPGSVSMSSFLGALVLIGLGLGLLHLGLGRWRSGR